jgi:hypothetical protein
LPLAVRLFQRSAAYVFRAGVLIAKSVLVFWVGVDYQPASGLIMNHSYCRWGAGRGQLAAVRRKQDQVGRGVPFAVLTNAVYALECGRRVCKGRSNACYIAVRVC